MAKNCNDISIERKIYQNLDTAGHPIKKELLGDAVQKNDFKRFTALYSDKTGNINKALKDMSRQDLQEIVDTKKDDAYAKNNVVLNKINDALSKDKSTEMLDSLDKALLANDAKTAAKHMTSAYDIFTGNKDHILINSKLPLSSPTIITAIKIAAKFPKNRQLSVDVNDFVDHLIDAGANVNQSDLGGETPLIHAIKNRESALANRLINADANVNQSDLGGETPLIHAIKNRDLELANKLIDAATNVNHKDNSKSTALHYAAVHNNPEIVSKLLAAGADSTIEDKNKETPLMIAIKNMSSKSSEVLIKHENTINLLDKYSDGTTLLAAAAKYSDNETIEKLLDKSLNNANKRAAIKDTLYDLVQSPEYFHRLKTFVEDIVEKQPKESGIDIQEILKDERHGTSLLTHAATHGGSHTIEYMLSKVSYSKKELTATLNETVENIVGLHRYNDNKDRYYKNIQTLLENGASASSLKKGEYQNIWRTNYKKSAYEKLTDLDPKVQDIVDSFSEIKKEAKKEVKKILKNASEGKNIGASDTNYSQFTKNLHDKVKELYPEEKAKDAIKTESKTIGGIAAKFSNEPAISSLTKKLSKDMIKKDGNTFRNAVEERAQKKRDARANTNNNNQGNSR